MEINTDRAVSGTVFPIGISDFENLISNGMVYIDKTSCLEELLTPGTGVFQILRPRRFGKTLAMSMLSCFLEMNYENPEDRSRPERLFRDLAIYKNRAFCDEYMGRYPVISISFKDVEGKNYHEAVNRIIAVFARLADKFDFLTGKENVQAAFLQQIRDLNTGKVPVFGSDGNFAGVNNNLVLDFLANLAQCLKKAFNKRPVIIIDEYDVPLQKASARGYYTDMLDVIRGILSAALKDSDKVIFKGFVTGCLRIAHQSIFTGINNFKANGIQDELLSGFIGLTKDETVKLLRQHNLENRLPDVIKWYDGYNFGGTEMLCPWSVLNFTGDALKSRNPAAFRPQNYWANSSGNDIIGLSMKHPRAQDLERIQHLLEGKSAEIALREFTSYPAITAHTDFDTFATMMLHTGYLTVVRDTEPAAKNRAVVRIPNNEVRECFSEKAELLFSAGNPEWLEKAVTLRDALLGGDTDLAQDIMNAMLRRFISVRDTSYEYYYHMFLSGALSLTADESVDVISQTEMGDGYPDIIIDNTRNREAVLLELKKAAGNKFSQLEKRAESALEQIRSHDYGRDFRERKYRRIFSFGVSFFGKECLVLRLPDNAAGN